MKEWFVTNKIQVFVKNPTLTLLKDDGTFDAGANIAWSVFASMVAYDTEELFEKTKIGKERNKQQGKSVGGQVHYGYRLNKDKFVEIDKAKDRLNDLYVDGMITKKKYEDKKITLAQQEALLDEESERITNEMDRLSDLMENLMNPDKVPLLKDVLNSTPEQKQNIGKKHISKVFIDFQGKDKIIEVHIRGGKVRKYLYKYQKNLPPTEIK